MSALTLRVFAASALATVCAGLSAPALAVTGPLPISQDPLYLSSPVPPMNMLVMGRDHKLFYEAYNDASDLTGNGQPDIGYKPNEIDYYGYFDSFKCYSYTSGRFVPSSTTSNKKCGSGWSGDFLNYVTTSRIDALRKVLYGGRRSTDTETMTVLERNYVPQDAHSWGKEYQSIERDGYDIREYTPLSLPGPGRYHLFANTSLRSAPDNPLLRVLPNSIYRIWEWVSIEQPVAGDRCLHGSSGPACTAASGTGAREDFSVRVQVCVPGLLEPNCKQYPSGAYKPTGLLQTYGEDNRMLFGLITGSYRNNLRGGVLRRNIGNMNAEIIGNTGQINPSFSGIIRTIDNLRIVDFRNDAFSYQGGWLATAPMSAANFPDWGNPVAEMMYESLRYFAGRSGPTAQFMDGITHASGESVTVRNPSRTLNLPAPEWLDPYRQPGGQPWCSRAAQLVISDVNPSYDGEFLPGSAFSSFSGDLPGFNASSEANAVWAAEHGGSSRHFIGQVGGLSDNAPTPKIISGFSNVRGLAPEEPTKQGTYYSAAVARFGRRADLRPDLRDIQNVQTYSVALSSPLPKIEFPIGNRRITLVPFAKSTAGFSINSAQTAFQPTNQIVDFYIEQWVNTDASNMDLTVNGGRPFARFRVNYEDVEQGADHDMDAIVRYTLAVTEDGQLRVELISEYAAGSIEQHMGYVISGTTQDGVYLEVRDCDTATPATPVDLTRRPEVATTCSGNNPGYTAGPPARRGTAYFLDTPNWGSSRPDGTSGIALEPVLPGACAGPAATRPAQCGWGLPLSSVRMFSPSNTPAATLLNDPLWYAAKVGAEANDGLPAGVTPPNYFLATNAATLEEQLSNLFNQILELSRFAGGIASSGSRIDSGSLAFIPEFDTRDWTGDLAAYRINARGEVAAEPVWRAANRMATFQSERPERTFTSLLNQTSSPPTTTGAQFSVAALGGAAAARTAIGLTAGDLTSLGVSIDQVFGYLLGDSSREQRFGGPLRNRSRPMGDVLGSQPAVMGREDYGWSVLPGAEGEQYASFLEAKRTRRPVVFVGANDGMLHAFVGSDSSTNGGRLLFSYVPWGVQQNMGRLANPDYFHRFFVDGSPRLGDIRVGSSWRTFLIGSTGAGGRSVFGLDVTNAESFAPGDIRWEFTHVHDGDLGATIGQPQLVRLTSGRWVVVLGNGYNSDNHRAGLFVLDAVTGQVLRKFMVGGGSADDPNGMAQPVVFGKVPGSLGADTVYAGDLHGNVWRFDLDGPVAEWSVGLGGQPLFTARDREGARQPITGGMDVIAHPDQGTIVYFGTGQYFLVGDNVVPPDPQVQTLYAVWDNGSPASGGRASLRAQTFVESNGFRSVSDNPVSWSIHRGWMVDLIAGGTGEGVGERFVSRPQVRLGRVFLPTFIPTGDQCSPGGENWLMVLNATSGAGGVSRPPDQQDDDCGADCGGVGLPPGPPSAPPPVIISPPDRGPEACDPDDPDCIPTCLPDNPGCRPLVPQNVCGNFVIPIPGQDPLVFARPCGRQSWRQLR